VEVLKAFCLVFSDQHPHRSASNVDAKLCAKK